MRLLGLLPTPIRWLGPIGVLIVIASLVAAVVGVRSAETAAAAETFCSDQGISLTYDVAFDAVAVEYAITSVHTSLPSECAGVQLDLALLDANNVSLGSGSGTVPSGGGAVVIPIAPPVSARRVTYVSATRQLQTVVAQVWITGGDGRTGSADDDGGGSDVNAVISLPSPLNGSNVDPATVRLCKASTAMPICGTASVAAHSVRVKNDGSVQARFSRKQTLALLSDVPSGRYVTLAVSGVVRPPNVNFVGLDDYQVNHR